MSKTDLKSKNIFDDLEVVLPRWNDNLIEEVVKEGQQAAANIIIYIALNSNENDTQLVNQKAKCFYNSISFLSKNDVDVILLTFQKILENKGCNRSRIILDMPLSTIKTDVLRVNDFNCIVIMALNYLPSIKIFKESTKQNIFNIFSILFDFMKVQNTYAVHVASAAYKLMKKYFMDIDFNLLEDLVKTTARTFMSLSFNTKSIEFCEKMVQILLKNWSMSKKILELNQLNVIYTWDDYDCYVAAILLNSWPSEPPKQLLISFAPRICSMLTKRNISSSAMMVLEAALPYLELEEWTNTFVPILIGLMPDAFEEQKAYMKSTLLESCNAVVKNYGAGIYGKSKQIDLNILYTVLLLYCEVQQGLLYVTDLKDDIEAMIYSSNSIVQNYAFKVLCIFHNKHVILHQWQLSFIIDYLEMAMFDVDTYCYNELHSLLSHVCVTANAIIKTNRSIFLQTNETLRRYVAFLYKIHQFCLENIISKSSRRLTIATQIFNLAQQVFKGDSHSLKNKYKFDKEDFFKEQQAPFFQYLKVNNKWYFDNAESFKMLHKAFYDNEKLYPELPSVILHWYSKPISNDLLEIKSIYKMGITLLSSKYDHESIEKGCHCISIILSSQASSEKYSDAISALLDQKLLNHNLRLDSSDELVQTVTSLLGLVRCLSCLLKSILITSLDDNFKKRSFDYCDNIIVKVLNVICHDPNKLQQFNLQRKVTEHTLIACLDVMYLLSNTNIDWFKRSLEICYLIIEKSNMKKPLTTSVSFIHKLSSRTEACNKAVVIQFLERVLNSIYMTSDHSTSKIRRKPEHRSTIHAIVTADQSHGHPLLHHTLDFLYEVLSNPSSATSFIVSSLHTIEILISDNSLRFTMQPYVIPTTIHCIDKFSSREWPIKNAAMQVLQSLVSRILGQKTNTIHRRNSIEEVFTVYPQLASYLYKKLVDLDMKNDHDSVVAILAIFSQSHSKLDVILNRDIHILINSFFGIFTDLICTKEDIIGKFAAKAFIALYPVVYIPFLINDIVEWIKVNFHSKSKNIFSTFMCMLKLLYEKFNVYNYVSTYNEGLTMIKLSLERLRLFLVRFNNVYGDSLFSLLSIKLYDIDSVEKSLESRLQSNTYQARLWLNNYVPYILSHVDIKKFVNILRVCLHNTCPLCLQFHCLNSILLRYRELLQQYLINEILELILDIFFCSTYICDCLQLVISYSHIILLLLKDFTGSLKNTFLIKIRSQYNSLDNSNLYIISTYISVLSHFCIYSNEDQIFIKNAITTYKNATMTDSSKLHQHVSITLKCLYKCVQISDRCHILKMAFILLMSQEYEVYSEICRFIAAIFNTSLSNVYKTLHTLISYEHLLTQIDTLENICMFLIDLNILVGGLDDIFTDCGQFYMKQSNDICLHKHYLKSILSREITNVFKLLPRSSCVEVLHNTIHILSC